MSLEKGKISSSQLLYLVISGILGAGLVNPPGVTVKQDAWIAIIFGFLLGLLISSIYLSLIARFPGKGFFEIIVLVYGAFLSKLIFLFSFYFFFIIVL